MASNTHLAGTTRIAAVLVGVVLLMVLTVGTVGSVSVADGGGADVDALSAQQQEAAATGVERGAELARERGANVSEAELEAATEAAMQAAAAHPDASPDHVRRAATGAAHGAFLQAQTAEVTQVQAVVGGSVRGALEQHQEADLTQVQSAAYGAAHGTLAQRQSVTVEQLQTVASGAASGAAASAVQRQVTHVGQIQEAAQGAAYGALSQRQRVTVEQLQAAAYGGAHGALDNHQETDVKQVQVAAIGGARGALKGAVSQRQTVTVEQVQSAARGGASGALFQAQRVTVEQIQIAAEGAARGACERAAQRQIVEVEQIQSAAHGAARGALTQVQEVSVTQIQSAARGAANGALEQYQSASVEQVQFAARGAARGAVSTQRADVEQVQRAASGAASGALRQAQSATVEQVQYAARGAASGVVAQRQSVEVEQAQAAAFGAADGAVQRAVQRQSVEIEFVQYAAHGAAEGALAQRTRITVEQTQAIASGAADGALRQVQRVTVEQVQYAARGAASGAATSAYQRTEVTVEQLQAASSGAAEGSLTQVQRVSVVQIQAAASGAARGALVQYTQVTIEQIQSAARGSAAGGVQIQQVTIIQIQVVTQSAASGALSQSVTASATQIQGAAEGTCRGILRQSQTITIEQSQYLAWLESAGAAQSAAAEGLTDQDQIAQNAEATSSNASVPEDEFDADVSFEDQDSDGTTVTVDSVTLSEGGFVVIRGDELSESDPLDVVGVSEYLEAGTHENVTVELFDVAGRQFNESALTADRTLSAVPHLDTDGDQEFTYVESAGDADGPYIEDGSPIGDDAEVSVSQATLTATLNVSDQPANDTVVVDTANLSGGGFVAIHSGGLPPDDYESGTLGDSIIGVSEYVEPGLQDDVTVELNESVNGSTTVFAVAYRDTDGNGEFGFVDSGGEVDAPYLEDDVPVFEQVELLGPDGNETGEDTGNETDDVTNETDLADATLVVEDQTGDGTTLTVENASATTEFSVTVRRNDTVLNESDTFAANETFAGTLALEPPLEENASLTVEVVETDNDTTLVNETVAYTVELAETEPANATLTFENQTTNGTALTVESATLPEGGFVVIREATGDDGAGPIVGVSEYLDDPRENLVVDLSDPITENGTLVAVAHNDSNDNQAFDFVATDGSEDGPYLVDGEAVADDAFVTVAANETVGNETVGNETVGNETVDNETVDNETETNGTDEDGVTNETAGVTELDACGVIDEPGRYVLTGNVTDSEATDCITINASDVVLDGDGHALDGVDTNGTVGVRLRQSGGEDTENVTVTDIVLTDWGTGIGQPESEPGNLVDVRTTDVTVSSNEYGIHLVDAVEATISNSTVQGNGFHGIYLRDFGEGVVITDNVIRSNGDVGINLFEGGSGARIADNRIENNSGDGMDAGNEIDDLQVTNNSVLENGGIGVEIDDSTGATVSANDVSGNDGDGINVQDVGEVTVAGNVVRDNGGNGVELLAVTGEAVDNRVADNDGPALYTAELAAGDLTVANLSLSTATVGFDEGRNVALDAVESPPPDPENVTGIEQYVEVNTTDADGTVGLRMSYTDAAIEGADVNESSLRLWQYDEDAGWAPLPGTNEVDEDANVVTATVNSSGVVAPFERPAPTPAAPNATLLVEDQVGNGTALLVENATATVDFRVTASVDGTVIGESQTVPGNESFVGALALDPLEENTTVTVAVVAVGTETELASEEIAYVVEVPAEVESVTASGADGAIELTNPNDVPVSVTVSNGSGVVGTLNLAAGDDVSLTGLSPGVYTLSAETEDGTPVPVNGEPESTVTVGETETATETPGETATATDEPTATVTPESTATPEPTATATDTPTVTATDTSTETATEPPTETPTDTTEPAEAAAQAGGSNSLLARLAGGLGEWNDLPLVAGVVFVAAAPLLRRGRRR